MSDGFSIDTSELDTLAADLDRHAGHVGTDVAAVVRRGALNVKRDAQAFATGISYAPHYPASIGYDIEGDGRYAQIEAVIGPDKDKPQGALGNILEYGVPSQNTEPRRHLGPALDREAPNFEKALGDVVEKVLRS